jgi:hypothetical protein
MRPPWRASDGLWKPSLQRGEAETTEVVAGESFIVAGQPSQCLSWQSPRSTTLRRLQRALSPESGDHGSTDGRPFIHGNRLRSVDVAFRAIHHPIVRGDRHSNGSLMAVSVVRLKRMRVQLCPPGDIHIMTIG